MYYKVTELAIFIALVPVLINSDAYKYDDGERDLDYNVESMLSRQNFEDPYLNGLLQRYRQVRESFVENSVDEDFGGKEDTASHSYDFDIRMPNVSPQTHDSYLCVSKSIPSDGESFIVGYKPIAEMHTAHHMLLFGCHTPLKPDGKVWNCGEMQGVCGYEGGQAIMYAWGRNAPPLKLPKDVGFHIGKNSKVKSLALQVHYGNVDKFKDGTTDRSGVGLSITRNRLSRYGGIYLLADGWSSIPPHKKKWHIDTGCIYSYPPTLHTFAFRVHAHKLSTVVSGYRVRDGKWTLIGKGNPQKPQAFYPSTSLDIKPTDKLVARCTYNSMSRNTVTHIGATMADEMCNFYIMYYFDATEGKPAPGQSCGMGEILDGNPVLQHFPADSDMLPKQVKRHSEAEELKPSLLHPETQTHHYKVVKDWPSESDTFGQITGVALDQEGHIVIFHRGRNTWDYSTFDDNNRMRDNYRAITVYTVIYLDPKTGRPDNRLSWGADMFYLPHGLTIDHDGSVWLTDVGLHQVFKFGANNRRKPQLTLGVAKEPGHDLHHFCKPTDVAVDRTGNFFVSDGYCNERVVVFTAHGRPIEEITPKKSKGLPAPDRFSIPHSLTLDEIGGILYVADRENSRVLKYNAISYKFIGVLNIKFPGPVYAVTYNRGLLHAATGASDNSAPKVLVIDTSHEKILTQWYLGKSTERPHDIAVSPDNKMIYIVEIGPNIIREFKQITQ